MVTAVKPEVQTKPSLQHMTVPAIIIFWAALLFILPPMQDMPYGRDQGIFVWVAQTLLLGGLPYVDAFDNKGPATFSLYALALWVGGGEAWALRALDTVLLLVSLAAMIDLVRHISNAQSAGLVALLALAVLHLDFWNLGQPDLWAGELSMLMLWLFLKNPSVLRVFAAGLLVGLATMLKIPYALLAIALIGALLTEKNYRQMLSFALGAAAMPVAFILLYALKGQLQTLWAVTFTYNVYVHADVPHKHFWWDLLTLRIFWPANTEPFTLFLFSTYTLLLVLTVGGLGVLWGEGRRREAKVLFLLWEAAYVIVTMQAKFFFYHYTLLSLLMALPAAVLLGRAKKWGQQAAVTLLLLVLAFPALLLTAKPLEWWQGHATRLEWQATSAWGDFHYGLVVEAADYVRQNSQPTDKIYLWGIDSLLYHLSQRSSPTRLGYNLPLVLAPPPLREVFAEEVEAALSAQPPLFIIVQLNDQNDLTPPSITTLPGFPALAGLLQREYRVRWENKAFRIYERVPLAQSP